MKELRLPNGKVALVDDDVYDDVVRYRWHTALDKYVMRAAKVEGVRKTIYLHRYIMNTPKHLVVDHLDENPLNCQRENMRNVTKSVNTRHRHLQPNNTTGYNGVERRGHRFICIVELGRIQVFHRTFDTPEEANEARIKFIKENGLD